MATSPRISLASTRGADKRALKQAAMPSSRRRICVATSIAETSVAVADVRVVIDAGFERLPVFDENANAEVVATTYASQQTADRRAARAAVPARPASATGSTRRRPSAPILPAKHEPASRGRSSLPPCSS